jgi:hypothetical protein
MQNRGLIKFFAIIFALVCVYQLSFTFVASGIEKDAKAYAKGDSKKELAYLDSIGKVEVYPVLGYTFNEVRQKQLNKGLDLEGGINVIFQISVKDVLKGLANDTKNPIFNKSLEEDAEKEYPKLIVENPSCNGYNEPNHIDINEECRNAFIEGVKSDEAKEYWFDIFKKNKEKWNKVTEDTPPSNIELLVKSPNGIIHLSRWRESYNIFGCQAKSESIVGWKWKKI